MSVESAERRAPNMESYPHQEWYKYWTAATVCEAITLADIPTPDKTEEILVVGDSFEDEEVTFEASATLVITCPLIKPSDEITLEFRTGNNPKHRVRTLGTLTITNINPQEGEAFLSIDTVLDRINEALTTSEESST